MVDGLFVYVDNIYGKGAALVVQIGKAVVMGGLRGQVMPSKDRCPFGGAPPKGHLSLSLMPRDIFAWLA